MEIAEQILAYQTPLFICRVKDRKEKFR